MAPVMMTQAPANMAFRRPNRSEATAAKGAPTIDPLLISTLADDSEVMTYTVYKEKTTETIPPVVPVWNVFWKCGIAMIAVIKDPSYPLAQAQQKATKTESDLLACNSTNMR
jgi:hypothetical protein